MSDRIRQLEDALGSIQTKCSTDPHPLLNQDLLRIKNSLELYTPTTGGPTRPLLHEDSIPSSSHLSPPDTDRHSSRPSEVSLSLLSRPPLLTSPPSGQELVRRDRTHRRPQTLPRDRKAQPDISLSLAPQQPHARAHIQHAPLSRRGRIPLHTSPSQRPLAVCLPLIISFFPLPHHSHQVQPRPKRDLAPKSGSPRLHNSRTRPLLPTIIPPFYHDVHRSPRRSKPEERISPR